MADSDTIFALATPPGRSALAVFRISGRRAGEVLDVLTRRARPDPRQAALRAIYDPESGEKIDRALVVCFEGPASYTGEDLVEVSVHGGRGVIAAISSALAGLDGVRSADPGEFTRRAYAAGKFDLSQAEAIADLIDSETEFQRRQALRLLDGGLGRTADLWRERLLAIAVELESGLDFSDEGDVSPSNVQTLAESAYGLVEEIEREISSGSRSLALRNGFTVVISGPPNVGKSTLFNKLAGSDLAIVTEFAGTTRDLIKVDLDLDGVPVTVVDSAGVREAVDPIERIGIERAQAAIASADLVVQLRTGDSSREIEVVSGFDRSTILDVWSKADMFPAPVGYVAISEIDSGSISSLVGIIRERALAVVGDGSEGSLIRTRHLEGLRDASGALQRFVDLCSLDRLELAAEECRLANLALGRISGSYETEELLGAIFARFCIGK